MYKQFVLIAEFHIVMGVLLQGQPFVYQPQETPQNPFLRSQIPLPDYQYNQWFQLWKKTLPMPVSFPQYNVFNNEQLVGLQKQRMEQQRSYQQQLALQRNLVLRKQQEAITKQIQEASKVRSLNAARVLQTHVQPVLNTASQRQSIQYQSPPVSYSLNQVPYSQPQNLALSPSYQPYPIQALSPQSWSGPESVKLWPPSDESSNIWNKGTSVNSFFGSRHSTCEQCNGDCRNYLCYGCGGCQEPPPEQQTYYYPYQRHDAAYHDAFLGNEMALSGMVIWPLPKIPWKTEAEKIEEEKKLARSKVEKDDDEDDDSNGDDDNDSDDNDLSLKKSKIMVKTIKKSNATKKISKKPLSNKPASTKKVMKKKKKHSRN